MRKTYYLTLLSSVLLSGCIALPIIPTGNNSTTTSSDSSNNGTRATRTVHLEDVEEICNLALKNQAKANSQYDAKYINISGKFTQNRDQTVNSLFGSLVGSFNKKYNVEIQLPYNVVSTGDFEEGKVAKSGLVQIELIYIFDHVITGKNHCVIKTYKNN